MSERMRLAVKAEFERYRMIHDQIVSVAVPDPDLWDWYYAIDCRGYVAVGRLLFDGENPSA